MDKKTFIIAGIMLYFGILLIIALRDKKSRTSEDYFLGGRKLPSWALAITFVASWWGAASALTSANEAYLNGIGAFWILGAPVLLSNLIMIMFAKMIRRIPVITQGQMFDIRYSRKSGMVLSLMIFFFMTITASSQMVGIGEFFLGYIGINYTTAVLIGTGIVFVYSVFGGFRAVVLTDIVQFAFLVIACVLVLVVGLKESGGLRNVYEASLASGQTEYFNFFFRLGENMPYVITFGAAWMIQANVWQRIAAARNENDARKMTVISFIIYIPLYFFVVIVGMLGLAMYKTMPEGGIIPSIIRDHMNPFFGMLMFVGIASAIMSTMDSLINTAAMTLTEDVYRKYIRPKAKNKEIITVSMLSTLLVVIIALFIAFRVKSLLRVSWIAADIIATGAFFPLVASFFWKRATNKGALASMITGSVFCFYNLLAELGFPLPLPWSGGTFRVIFGMGISLLIFVIVSLSTKDENDKAEKYIDIALGK